jgi:PIN domain nuclease of toxin-antitoxin system
MVIDASALIAYFRHETGYKQIEHFLLKGGLSLSSVNRTEIKGKLVGTGLFTANQINEALANLEELLEVIPFDTKQSDVAAYYYARRHPYQLSLGDCACLALAEIKSVNVITAEAAWSKLPDLPFKVSVIR